MGGEKRRVINLSRNRLNWNTHGTVRYLVAVQLWCVPPGVVVYVRFRRARGPGTFLGAHKVTRVQVTHNDGTCKILLAAPNRINSDLK